MNWFNILKVLGTKSGYAQLDFDNIIEEEKDNCKKRWQELMAKIRNPTGIGAKALIVENYGTRVYLGDSPDEPSIRAEYSFDESVPEEVYCKALEVLETNPNDADTIDIGEYNIDFYNSFDFDIGSLFAVAIWPSGRYSDDPLAQLSLYIPPEDRANVLKEYWTKLRSLLR